MILQKHAQTINFVRLCTDLFMVFATWVLCFIIRFDSGMISLPKGDDTLPNYLRLSPVLLLSYLFTFLGTGVYVRSMQRRRIWEEHFDMARSHIVAFVVFVTIVYFLFEHRYSRITLLLFFFVTPITLPIGRSVVRKFNRAFLRRTTRKLRAILIGSGAVAKRIAELSAPENEWRMEIAKILPVFNHQEIKQELQTERYDVAFFAPLPEEGQELYRVYQDVGNTVAEIILLPDFGMPMLLAPRINYLAELPALALNSSKLDGYGALVKRAFDIVFASCFITIFSPLYLLCAFLVKVSSKGPILYKQERMGLDGKTFQCLKFRGMYVNAESTSGPVWATKSDNRVTPVGKWLRRTSLDEIPQFFNVLMGDMSVVGPRPERPVFVADFRSKIPGYMLRHKVKAGITGWAQINGWRGDTSLEKRIACDLWYMQNWSIWLDLKICLMTPVKGLIHPNAY